MVNQGIHESMIQGTNESAINESMNERMNEWMDGWMVDFNVLLQLIKGSMNYLALQLWFISGVHG